MDELQKWLDERSQEELARQLGITQGAVSQWVVNGRIPVSRVRAVERITGIPAAKLCPEIFGHAAA